MRITHIVVHYTATYPDQDTTAADVDQMHRAKGWRGMGYHWFIRRNGLREPGRPESQVGAHVGGQNTGKIGVAWAGGIERATGPNVGVDNRTRAQTKELIKLIRELLTRYPDARVVGHRDLASTQCPGFDVQEWWAGVQKEPARPHNQPSPNAPALTPDVSEELWHTVRKGDTLWSISRQHGLELDDLLRLNSLNEHEPIIPGERILLRPMSKSAITGLIGWLKSLLSKGD